MVKGWMSDHYSECWFWKHWHQQFYVFFQDTSLQRLPSQALDVALCGALWGLLHCSRTLCIRNISQPRNKRIAAQGSTIGISSATALRCGWSLAISGDGISDLSSGSMSHSIKVGKEIWVLPSNDSTKLLAHLLTVSITPEHVFKVYGIPFPLMAKWSNNWVLAKDLLLCSSRTAKALIAFSFCPAVYTLTREIFEHDLELVPLPQILMHLDVTDKALVVGCSPPWSVEAHLLAFQGAGPGCTILLFKLCS